jgi:hypothetical protein
MNAWSGCTATIDVHVEAAEIKASEVIVTDDGSEMRMDLAEQSRRRKCEKDVSDLPRQS